MDTTWKMRSTQKPKVTGEFKMKLERKIIAIEETTTNFRLETISDYLKFRKKNVHNNYIVHASNMIN